MWRAFWWGALLALSAGAQELPRVRTVDAVTGAGVLREGKLQVQLEISEGRWFPEGEGEASVVIQAFAQAGRPPQNPGPILRVREGVPVEVMLHNKLAVRAAVFGFYQRPGDAAKSKLELGPGETKTVTFLPGSPGAYLYFANTEGAEFTRNDIDSQLNGVILVDPVGGPVHLDRILMISDWFKPGPDPKNPPAGAHEVWALNGKMWPYTTPSKIRTREKQTWLVANATVDAHPMHLHGNYFTVEQENGDGEHSAVLPIGSRFLEVTHTVPSGGATVLSFSVQRPGNWLFHCHMLQHTAPLWGIEGNKQQDPHAHMSGLAVGLEVSGPAETMPARPHVRKLQLVLQPREQKYEGGVEGISARIFEKGIALPASSPLVGPVLQLVRGEPVEIEVSNQMHAPTSVHWHGIELESYYDGVPGYGGEGGRVAPLIDPGGRFTVRFTPPRAGTFIYHSHYRDMEQIGAGLYGALIVREPHEIESSKDEIVLLAGDGAGDSAPFLINGERQPGMTLQTGTTYRFRFINMRTTQGRRMRLLRNGDLVQWTRQAKDGADLPPSLRTAVPAEQMVMPGETYDFLFTPQQPGTLSLETGRKDPEMKVPVRVVDR